jgi:ribosome-binding factor A
MKVDKMSRTHPIGAAQSQRMLRVAERIRHALAQALMRGIDDPLLSHQTGIVAAVRMSPDLRLATIFFRPQQDSDSAAVAAAFERHRKFLRGEIARSINLKFAPEIRFRIDQGAVASARIDALLRDPFVERDLVNRANLSDEKPK